MPVTGPISHVDISVSRPEKSIPFYEVLLTALDFVRSQVDHPEFRGPEPSRACWELRYHEGATFSIEVRPASGANRARRYDRYAPGTHHTAFHAESRKRVDSVHKAMLGAGFEVLDAPRELTGQGYGDGYYAAFYADPDGQKVEVVYHPPTNP
jgi:catechol 2,3-dioxygenase-like lactoylglutathione lyase family enzyme